MGVDFSLAHEHVLDVSLKNEYIVMSSSHLLDAFSTVINARLFLPVLFAMSLALISVIYFGWLPLFTNFFAARTCLPLKKCFVHPP